MASNLPAERKTTDVANPLDLDALKFLQEQERTDDFKAGDLVVPWLVLVQTSGGYMKQNNPNYNREAREGDITDNLTKRLRSHQAVILCKYETHFTTWKPGGGKLVKQWFTDPSGWNAARYPDGKTFGNKIDADGNEVTQSAVYYILAVDLETGIFKPMVWSLASTQYGKAKKVNSLANEMMLGPNGPFTPPIYSRLFDLTSAIETGGPDGNKSWAGWVINVGDAVLANKDFGMLWTQAAIEFRKSIAAGHVRPMPPESQGDAQDASYEEVPRERYEDGLRKGGQPADGEEIPF